MVTSLVPGAAPSSDGATAPSAPRLYRRARHRVLAGVAGGIADHLRISPVAVRVAFVVLAAGGGLGLALYAVFWIVVPPPPGESRRTPWWTYVLAAAIAVASFGIAVNNGPVAPLFVPSVLALIGGALIWRQASDTERAEWWKISRRSLTAAAGPGGCAGGRDRLVVVGGIVVIARADFSALRDGVVAVLVTAVGIALITGPWWVGMVSQLGAERTERIRSQERAELAAKLHDSVLQTLALIQRNAGNPREVARLARGQERELRTLLYGPEANTGRLAKALSDAAAEIEDAYAVTVDAVVVGDSELDDDLRALVASAREAMQNAAKHAQVRDISLYAEVEAGAVVAYVRDRGVGFDAGGDRRGPPGCAWFDHRADRTTRRHRHDSDRGRRRYRGCATDTEEPMTSGPAHGTNDEGVEPAMTVTVFLVDDHALFRTGVKAELGALRETGIEVVGEAGSVAEAVVRITSRPAGRRAAGRAHARRRRPRRPGAGPVRACPTWCSWRCRCPTPPRTSSM